MALSYRARRIWTYLILLVGLPVYVVAAVSLINWIEGEYGRAPVWLQLIVYVALGFLWALPFRSVFRGVARDDPDRPPRP
ncbi:DUF2842 domain-containing protein [Rubellimicrobium arenae]|uniref:DUF2842 domain-containing protein n=1 Tax=Rubellimicrobium arenae TaxID=2817372 RepID=UPI001B311127|nr:DUF2842 domain-containing protein [Rubellimicrobium arenae]